jgi:hypothetical protein
VWKISTDVGCFEILRCVLNCHRTILSLVIARRIGKNSLRSKDGISVMHYIRFFFVGVNKR